MSIFSVWHLRSGAPGGNLTVGGTGCRSQITGLQWDPRLPVDHLRNPRRPFFPLLAHYSQQTFSFPASLRTDAVRWEISQFLTPESPNLLTLAPVLPWKEGTCPSPHLSLFPPTLRSLQWSCVISGSLFLFAQYFSSAFKHTQVSSILKDTKTTFLWPHEPPPATLPTVSLRPQTTSWSSDLLPHFILPSPMPPTWLPLPPTPQVSPITVSPLFCRSCAKYTNDWGRCISRANWKRHLFIWASDMVDHTAFLRPPLLLAPASQILLVSSYLLGFSFLFSPVGSVYLPNLSIVEALNTLLTRDALICILLPQHNWPEKY